MVASIVLAVRLVRSNVEIRNIAVPATQRQREAQPGEEARTRAGRGSWKRRGSRRADAVVIVPLRRGDG